MAIGATPATWLQVDQTSLAANQEYIGINQLKQEYIVINQLKQ